MKTARPIVSKTQRAASGIRPNVGRTERSQPKTSPMMSAPPLAVRESGMPPTLTERSPTSPPTTMPRPTKTTSVALDGRSTYPSALPARSTSRAAPASVIRSPRLMTVEGTNGISSPPRTSFESATPRPCFSAISASVRSATVLFVTTTSRTAAGNSSSVRSSISTPIGIPPERTLRRAAIATASPRRSIVVGRRLEDLSPAVNLLDEDPLGSKGLLEIGDTPVRPRRVVDPVGAQVPFPVCRRRARSELLPAGDLRLELAALGLQVHLEELWREAREEPHDESRADEVGHGVGHRDVVLEPGLFFLGQIEALDRVARRADDRRFREGSGHQARRGPAVVVEDLRGRDRGDEARHTENDRQRHLRQRVLTEPPDELGADLVPGREEKEVEEDDLDDRVDGNVELSDEDAGQQRPDDVSELEGPEPNAPEHEPHCERQEDGELGIVAKSIRHVFHATPLPQRATRRSHGVPTRSRTRILKAVVIVPSR